MTTPPVRHRLLRCRDDVRRSREIRIAEAQRDDIRQVLRQIHQHIPLVHEPRRIRVRHRALIVYILGNLNGEGAQSAEEERKRKNGQSFLFSSPLRALRAFAVQLCILQLLDEGSEAGHRIADERSGRGEGEAQVALAAGAEEMAGQRPHARTSRKTPAHSSEERPVLRMSAKA